MDRITFSITDLFSDTEGRTISGIAVPSNTTAEKGGRLWRFKDQSVRFGVTTPLLQYHDPTRPIGRLTASEWIDEGLRVKFAVSNTVAGTEALQLAHDQVLSMSLGISEVDGTVTDDQIFEVTDSLCEEISLTPLPVFAGAQIQEVKLSREAEDMPTAADNTADLAAQINKLTEVVTTFANRPEAQPTPAPAVVKEAPLYVIGKPDAGQHSFGRDLSAAMHDDAFARERLDKYIKERFANEEISTGDVSGMNPATYRPDLYVGQQPVTRVFPSVITTAPLSDITPFAFPKLNTVDDLTKPHVQGVEPSLGGATWTSSTITPTAISGKSEINREVIDQMSPQIESMIWNLMLSSLDADLEARVVAMLDGLSLPAGQLKTANGKDATLANNLDTLFLSLPNQARFTSMVDEPSLFNDTYSARDSSGRKLFAAVNPSNADGTGTRLALDLGGVTAVKSDSLSGKSYVLDRSTVFQFVSTPQRLDFNIQVKSVYLGLFCYSAEAITDTTGVYRVTHT